MTQIKLSRWLKTVILAVAVLGLLILFGAIPLFAVQMRTWYPEFSDAFWPWLGFLWISGVPCYGVLAYAWKIAKNIGLDRSFSVENAMYFQRIAAIMLADCLWFTVGNFALLFCNWNHPGIVIGLMVVPAFGVCIAVAAACLSHLVHKAAALQEQSDLTI